MITQRATYSIVDHCSLWTNYFGKCFLVLRIVSLESWKENNW